MSRVGRPPNIVPSIEWSISLPSDMAAQVELLLLDPIKDKPKAGSRSKLVEQLLRAWLEERKRAMRAQRREPEHPSWS